MSTIRKIETKEEWIKLIVDGAKGISNLTSDEEYIYWAGDSFMYSKGGLTSLAINTGDFGIIEEPKTKIIKEWMYKYTNEWYINTTLMTDEEAKEYFMNCKDYRPTGRQWEVPIDG